METETTPLNRVPSCLLKRGDSLSFKLVLNGVCRSKLTAASVSGGMLFC